MGDNWLDLVCLVRTPLSVKFRGPDTQKLSVGFVDRAVLSTYIFGSCRDNSFAGLLDYSKMAKLSIVAN